jgi:crotonobetainyl-CoA:carnitine CoA-transferase CaiB-like acyl-CoA transferase
MHLIGRDDLVEQIPTRGSALSLNLTPEVAEAIETSYMAWLMERDKHAAAAALQGIQLLAAPVNTVRDLFDDPSFEARGFYEVIDHPETGPLRYPGRPFLMSESPRPPARRAPLLGEHNEAVLCGELGLPREDLARLSAQGVI